jgi:hypothetical protein
MNNGLAICINSLMIVGSVRGATPPPTILNIELREDGGYELREDGGLEVRQ